MFSRSDPELLGVRSSEFCHADGWLNQSFPVCFDVVLRVVQHEMDIEKELGLGPQVSDGLGAEGQVWDEVSIHDIDVKPFGSNSLNCIYVIG